jgi:hypothetical protein
MRNKLINIYSFNYNLNNLLIQKYKYIIINFHKKIIGDNIKIQIIFHLNLKVNNFDSIESYFNNESISKFNYIKTFNPLYISKNTKKNAFYNYLDTLLDSTFIVCNSGENLTINKIEIHYFYLLDDKGN